jgi:hypothetical protein
MQKYEAFGEKKDLRKFNAHVEACSIKKTTLKMHSPHVIINGITRNGEILGSVCSKNRSCVDKFNGKSDHTILRTQS